MLGVALTCLPLLKTKPEGWAEALDAWAKFARDYWWLVSALALGAGCALGLRLRPSRQTASAESHASDPHLADPEEFRVGLRTAASTGRYDVMRVFGYTAETLQDYFGYDLRRKAEAPAVRLLLRSWIDEQRDEEEHNHRRPDAPRKWNKAAALGEHKGLPVGVRGEMRFYSGLHPFVKCAILSGGEGHIAFLCFYRWVEWPEDGGSQFKATNPSRIVLKGTSAESSELITALISQFEYIWSCRSHGVDGPEPAGPDHLSPHITVEQHRSLRALLSGRSRPEAARAAAGLGYSMEQCEEFFHYTSAELSRLLK